jgi:hypothetical protein
VLEIGGGDNGAGDGRVELVSVDAGAAGPESLAFDPAGGGPYAGVSDGRVLRWVPGERLGTLRVGTVRTSCQSSSSDLLSLMKVFLSFVSRYACNTIRFSSSLRSARHPVGLVCARSKSPSYVSGSGWVQRLSTHGRPSPRRAPTLRTRPSKKN